MESLSSFRFGYVPDSFDERDYVYVPTLTAQLSAVDLSDKFFPIRNQGELHSCTSFAIGAMVEYVRTKENLKPWVVSPLFTYYATRKIANLLDQDIGACVRDALKSSVNYGVTREDYWPYLESSYTTNPPLSVWQDAEKHQALSYFRLKQDKDSIISCLNEGFPFAFGAMLYDSFIKTQNGTMVYNYLPMPNTTKEKMVGGHCMLAVGYSTWNNITYIKVRNSWGDDVGLNGYHNMPLDYLLDPKLSIDFWTIRSEEHTEEEVIPVQVEVKPSVYVAPPLPEPPKPFDPPMDTKWIKIGVVTVLGLMFLALLLSLLNVF